MRRNVVSLLVMLFPARYAARSATAEVTERLLAGQGPLPGADATERALSQVLTAAARPGTASELYGQTDAVTAFLREASLPAPRRTRVLRAVRWRLPYRVPVLAGAFAALVIISLYGTARIGVLPPAIQQAAHSMGLGPAPSTAHPTSGVPSLDSSTAGPAAGHRTTGKPAASATPGDSQGNSNGQGSGNSKGSGNGQGKGTSGGTGNGTGNGQGKGTSSGSGSGNSSGQGSGSGQGSVHGNG